MSDADFTMHAYKAVLHSVTNNKMTVMTFVAIRPLVSFELSNIRWKLS